MDAVQEIKEKIDIVDVVKDYIPLFNAGKNFKATCPFHKEKTPSFIVSPDRQTWHCFGSCNEGGDVISFVMKYENVEFYEALKMLAERAGVELKQISPSSQKEFGVLYDINQAVADYYKDQLAFAQNAREYLEKRGLRKDIIDEFEIGYSPHEKDSALIHLVNRGYDTQDIERAGIIFKTDRGTYIDRFRGRLMFPLYNTLGKIVGFSGRILPEYDDGKSGKYVNSPETLIFNKSKILYGVHKTKPYIKENKEAVLVEGQMDLLMLYQDGVRNAIAVSGTALTNHHLETLKKIADSVIFAFDSDEAGLAATERAVDMAHILDYNVKAFTLTDAKDAAEFIQNNPGKICSLISSQSVPAFEFYYKNKVEQNESKDLKMKIRGILSKIFHIASPIEQNSWMRKIAERTNISETALYEEYKIMKKPKSSIGYQTEDGTTVKNQPTNMEVILSSRMHKLTAEIIILALIDKENRHLLGDYKNYFPEPLDKVADYVLGQNNGEKEGQFLEMLSYFEMKSSLRNDEIEREKVNLEISFLLKELKREYLKNRKNVLLLKLKEAEQKGDQKTVEEALKEFDEITKLIDN